MYKPLYVAIGQNGFKALIVGGYLIFLHIMSQFNQKYLPKSYPFIWLTTFIDNIYINLPLNLFCSLGLIFLNSALFYTRVFVEFMWSIYLLRSFCVLHKSSCIFSVDVLVVSYTCQCFCSRCSRVSCFIYVCTHSWSLLFMDSTYANLLLC